MSKHSLKFVIKEDKFNLKTIIYLFILIDLFLIPFGLWIALWYLIIYQASIIIGLMIGLRGMNKYKLAMGELQSIARDKSLSVDQREHMLVQGVHHWCLELGTIYMERLEDFKKKQKKLMEVIKKMDDKILEAIGLWLVSILAIFTPVLGEWLYLMGVSGFWILFILAVWDLTDALLLIIIIFYFKLRIEDIEPVPIGRIAAVKGEIKEINTQLQ